MLSRIAESLFWMNRYMERSDCLIRSVRTNYILSFDKSEISNFSWKDIIELFAYPKNDNILEDADDLSKALPFLVTYNKNINSLKTMVTKARENARGMQDNISKELWEHINQFYHLVNKPDLNQRLIGDEALVYLDDFEKYSMIYFGVVDSATSRGDGWSFMNIGKFLERSYLTIDMTIWHYEKLLKDEEANGDILHWRSLLLSMSGYEFYLKTYNDGNHHKNIMKHIVFNTYFTRSVIYCVQRIKRYLNDVAANNEIEGTSALCRKIGLICSKVEYSEIGNVYEAGLPQFLSEIRAELNDFSKDLTRTYFSYA